LSKTVIKFIGELFWRRNVVVALVAPEPRTCSLEEGDDVPIPAPRFNATKLPLAFPIEPLLTEIKLIPALLNPTSLVLPPEFSADVKKYPDKEPTLIKFEKRLTYPEFDPIPPLYVRFCKVTYPLRSVAKSLNLDESDIFVIRNVPTTSVVVRGVDVPIPTLPLPLTNNILEEAGESTRSRAADEAPDMWSWDVGVVVPIPMLPLSNTTNEADAFVFSTRRAVVADVAPEPRTDKRAPESVLDPITKLRVL
jgi:hypothetical protein